MELTRSIKDHTSLLAACQLQANHARLFNMNLVDLDGLFDVHVYDEIAEVPTISILDNAVLTAYARGYYASLIHSIRTLECEFVYRDSMGVTFSTKVGMSSRPFYGNMTMVARSKATTGYVWRGTDMPFTAFTREQAANEEAA